MGQQNMIWLSTSLFSSKKNWHRLITYGIAPFVKDNVLLKGYTLECNYLSGENIRLALLTCIDNQEELAKTVNEHFKNFFFKALFPDQAINLPVSGIFSPFPTNTIQYGLYPPQTIVASELKVYKVSMDISKIIIDALKDEIDDETIITFAFYLQVAIVKVVFNKINDAERILSFIASGNNQKSDKSAETVFSNQDLMDEITWDVMQSDKFYDELRWVNDWVNQCEASLKTILTTDSDKSRLMRNFYLNHAGIICDKLGINVVGRNLLSYSVDRSVGQYFKLTR